IREVPWQETLQTMDCIEQQGSDQARKDKTDRVDFPIHLVGGVNTGYAIDQTLDWPQNRVKKGFFPFKDTSQVAAYRFDKKRHNQQKQTVLQQTPQAHGVSSRPPFLRTRQLYQ